MRMPLYAGLAIAATVTVAAASLLWLRVGESIYVDRLVAAIAGCF